MRSMVEILLHHVPEKNNKLKTKVSFLTFTFVLAVLHPWVSIPNSLSFLFYSFQRFSVFFVRSYLNPPCIFLAVNLMVFLIYRLCVRDNSFCNTPKVDQVVGAAAAGQSSDNTNSSNFSASMSPDTTRPEEQEEENDSMDATWQGIMAGRRLLKSDSWEKRLEKTTAIPERTPAARETTTKPAPAAKKEMRKSETFREGRQRDTTDRGRRWRESLLEEQEELNRRFEAFIRKTRQQMRMQSQ